MRIPLDETESAVYGILAAFGLLLGVFWLRESLMGNPGLWIFCLGCTVVFFFSLIMAMADYWVDETGVYVRTCFGKVVIRRLSRERVRFFGAVIIVSGRYRKAQITFCDRIPAHPYEGYSERFFGMIHFAYTRERWDAVCRIFHPAENTVIVFAPEE